MNRFSENIVLLLWVAVALLLMGNQPADPDSASLAFPFSNAAIKDTGAAITKLKEASRFEKDRGNYALSLRLLFKLQKLIDKNEEQLLLSNIDICGVYLAQGNLPLAKQYLSQIEEGLYKFHGDRYLGHLYWLKGEIALVELRLADANEHALKGLVLFNSAGNKLMTAEALHLLSRVYFEQNKLTAAAQCARRYKKVSMEQGNDVMQANAFNLLALVYGRLNMRDSALWFSGQAMKLAKATSAIHQEAKIFHTLHLVYDYWGQPSQALAYYKRYTSLNDSLVGDNRAREIAQLAVAQEAEKQKEVNDILVEKAAIQQSEIDRKAFESKMYLLGLILFILLGALAAFSLLKAREANKKLLRLTNEMRESRDKISRTSDKLADTNKKLVKIQAALIAQKDTAERASKAKDVFLSSVSHELRTPLTAILGLTDELLPTAETAQTKENLEVIKFSGETLLSLVNDILDYNKIQSGRIELEAIDFNLREYFGKQVKGLKPRARQNAVNLIFTYDPALPEWVKGDPVRIGQVTNNLLSNAIKFTHHGNVELCVNMVGQEKDIFHLHIAVKDQGIGIPKDKQAMVFEMFTQASTDTTRKFGGTGLGLAISKRIVELYRSSIQVESEPGIGSTFSFILSLPMGQPTTTIQMELGASDLPTGINILLVEDNAVNQKLAAKAFSGAGVDIDVVSNGKQALDAIEKGVKEYDLILMDMHMPVMDGMEATRIIRAKGGYLATMPIIGLSGSTIKEEHELKDIGLSAFMQKPFKKDDLLRLVAEWLIKA
ncbi:MAG: response regulator [Bacteroidetes bacterium]|nr:response regulator [Bacteroidota bacterium]